MMKRKALMLLGIGYGFWCALDWQTPGMAHGVTIEYQATQAYQIQVGYDTGEPMANAQVAVFSPDNAAQPWLTGTTDAAGKFVFSPSTSGDWEVQVRQAGHGHTLVIPVTDEISATPAAEAANAPTASATAPASTTAESASTPMTAPAPAIASSAIAETGDRYTPLQKSVMIGSVIWGCVGTALFFTRGKKRLDDAHS